MIHDTDYMEENLMIEIEYALRRDLHAAMGEIIELEYENAKIRKDIRGGMPSNDELLDDLKEVVGDRCPDVDPDDIGRAYIMSAFRYLIPGLDDPTALLGDDDRLKIKFATAVLEMFDLESMKEYKRLSKDRIIGISCIDRRIKPRVE